MEGEAETHCPPPTEGDKSGRARKAEGDGRGSSSPGVPIVSQALCTSSRRAPLRGVYRWGDAPSKAVYFA